MFTDNVITVCSQYLHETITGNEITEYGMSCYNRWLAYSAEDTHDPIIVCDYDIINHSFEPIELSEKMHLMDDACPCIASGTPRQFEKLCHSFVDISQKRLGYLSSAWTDEWVHYHDQEFFVLNFTNEHYPKTEDEEKIPYHDMLELHDIKMTRDHNYIAKPFFPNEENSCKAFHVSHWNAGEWRERNETLADIDLDDIRLELANQIIQ